MEKATQRAAIPAGALTGLPLFRNHAYGADGKFKGGGEPLEGCESTITGVGGAEEAQEEVDTPVAA